jgi:hypothetical protein
VAEWALAAGRSCDLDVAALCLDALERYRTPEGIRLDRPDVNGILWADIRNAASLLDTMLPSSSSVDLWTVLHWCHETGGLTADSDPLPALLEPLRCYGGLGEDGYPMPDGVDVDFPCQCYVPYDPTLPPGMGQHIVGRDRHREYLVRAHLRPRAEEPLLSSYRPLFALARRLHDEGRPFDLHPDDFTYLGWIDPQGDIPRLWIYALGGKFNDLVLADDGTPWVPKTDGRRRAGFRWVIAGDRAAVIRAGVGYTRVSDADRFERDYDDAYP